MAWMRYTAGRLKSDYRYSAGLVYNNYPWPEAPTPAQRAAVEKAAQAVLNARAAFPGSTLADLYTPLAMPPALAAAPAWNTSSPSTKSSPPPSPRQKGQDGRAKSRYSESISMSVRCFYIDESYNQERFCLSAIAIRHDQWRDCFGRVQQHRRLLKQDHGIFIRKEIHAHELVGGRGQIADQVVNKHTRSRIFHGLLRLVAELPDVLVFNVCLEIKGRRDPQLDAWDRLLNRIERTMLAFEQRELPMRKELLSKLPPNSTTPGDALQSRLLKYAPRALIFADQGRELEITRVYRKMTVFNPIPSRFGSWTDGATKNLPLQRIIEDPVFKPSHHSFFIQLADCVSFALLKRETPPTPNIAKYGIEKFFDQCLSSVCYKSASPRDPLGIVRK